MEHTISFLFDLLEEAAPDETSRKRLGDARRAALLVHAVPSERDRAAVLNVLGQLETLCELADSLAGGKVVAFPGRGEPYYIDDADER